MHTHIHTQTQCSKCADSGIFTEQQNNSIDLYITMTFIFMFADHSASASDAMTKHTTIADDAVTFTVRKNVKPATGWSINEIVFQCRK